MTETLQQIKDKMADPSSDFYDAFHSLAHAFEESADIEGSLKVRELYT